MGRYRAAKRERDLLDFGDQIALSATLASTRPEVGGILRDEFRVVLLDEYQDTSVAQRILLAGLFGSGTGHPVTAVGDPCQAIYGWRGASVANLDDFPEHFAHADGRPATRQSLSENRRSGGRLLDLANGLAEPLRALHAGVEALRPAPGAERDGMVRCALLRTHAEEMDWLADSIAHLVRTGKAPGEIAVLCRTATDFAEIQGALVARDIPVEVVGLSGLLHLPEVADLVAVCEVLQDPGANASLVRLLTGPRWRIGARDLALLGRRARLLVSHARVGADDDPDRRLAAAVEGVDPAEIISLADALDTFLETPLGGHGDDDGLPFSADARVRFARLATELRDLRRSLSDPLMDVLHRVLATTGLEVELSASPHALAARRRETLSNFLDVAAVLRRQRRRGHPPRLPRLPAHRRPVREGPRQRPAGRREHRQGAHRAQVQGPGMGRRRGPRPRHRHLPQQPGPREVDRPGQGPAARTPRRRRHPAGHRRLGLPQHEGLPRGHEGAPAHRGTPPRLRHVHPPPLPAARLRPLVGPLPEEAPRPLRLPAGPVRALRGRARRDRGLGGRTRGGRGEPRPARGRRRPRLAAPARRRGHGPPPRGRADGPGPPGVRPLPRDGPPLGPRRPGRRTTTRTGRLRPDDEPPYDEPPYGEDDFRTSLPTGTAISWTRPTERRHTGRGPADPPRRDRFHRRGSPGDWDSWTPNRPRVPHPTPSPDAHPTRHRTRARTLRRRRTPPARPAHLTPEEARTIASWDRDLDALTGELLRARESVTDVPLPASLTASQLLRLAADPDVFAQELARPMPRPPQPAARRGTRFHAWVEARFEALRLPMLEPEELPGSEAEIADERDLEALKDAFERTPYAHRTPYRVEAPFQLAIAGRVVRGRIDAVYKEDDGDGTTYEIVDWKTNRTRNADPLQLAVYRLAWAEQHGVPLESVQAAFLYVRSGEVVRPAEPARPGRTGAAPPGRTTRRGPRGTAGPARARGRIGS